MFVSSRRLKYLVLPLSLTCALLMGCSDSGEDLQEEPTAETDEALCKAKKPHYLGVIEGYASYSNSCRSWQTKCVGPLAYWRALTRKGDVYSMGEWFRSGMC